MRITDTTLTQSQQFAVTLNLVIYSCLSLLLSCCCCCCCFTLRLTFRLTFRHFQIDSFRISRDAFGCQNMLTRFRLWHYVVFIMCIAYTLLSERTPPPTHTHTHTHGRARTEHVGRLSSSACDALHQWAAEHTHTHTHTLNTLICGSSVCPRTGSEPKMNPACARCARTVYPTEKISCLDKVTLIYSIFTPYLLQHKHNYCQNFI